jgi:hypothetical protein
MAQSFDNSVDKTITFTGFTTSSYSVVEEVSYRQTLGLLTNKTSTKVRVVADEVIPLDPNYSLEQTSLSLYGRDSNKLEIVFSPDTQMLLDAASNLGNFNIKDYIGDPRTTTDARYIALDSFLRNNWEQRLRNVPISNYVKLFKLYDQGLFEQLKQLIPARVSPNTGFTIGLQNLYRNKVEKIRETGEVFDLTGDLETRTLTPIMTEDSVNVTVDTLPSFTLNIVDQINVLGVILNETSKAVAEITGLTLVGNKVVNPEGIIDVPLDEVYILELVHNINAQTDDDGTLAHLTYLGTQISAPGFNLPTPDTLDKKSVVEYVDLV